MTMTQEPWASEAPVDAPTPGRLTTPADAQAYVLAGNATVTLVSVKTGTRFTYRVRSTPPNTDGQPSSVSHFVSLLNGSDNESSYIYIGCIKRGVYVQTAKSRVSADAASHRAFDWFFNAVLLRAEIPPELEVWHEGRCGACGYKLTVPESIARGLGPECAKRN